MIERLIVGTGAASAAAAMALWKRSVPFEVVDVGFDLEPEREQLISRLARDRPARWDASAQAFLYPPPVASARGVKKRFAFGSDFPYRDPGVSKLVSEGCEVAISHGFGGFANVWGAATLPFAVSETAHWKIDRHELETSYREVGAYVPISGAMDDLIGAFPTFSGVLGQLPQSVQGGFMLDRLQRRRANLSRHDITFGRARLAVETRSGATMCQRCGQCLGGCAYAAIFNPRDVWRRLERAGVRIHRGCYALRYREQGDNVVLRYRHLASGEDRELTTRRLFLGLGAVGSTQLIARSLDLAERPIRLLDSQYFFFPFISYRALPVDPIEFTLAEVFIEMLDRRSGTPVHFQVYGLNPIFRDTITAMVPRLMRRPALLRHLSHRFFLFQGFVHSSHSGHLEMTLARSAEEPGHARIRGVPNAEAAALARRARAQIGRRLAGVGIIPGPVEMVPLGRSFHVGGSFPMGGTDPVLSSDELGRPAGSTRVHVMDASTFPTIPPTTITYSIMANADRIGRLSLQLAP